MHVMTPHLLLISLAAARAHAAPFLLLLLFLLLPHTLSHTPTITLAVEETLAKCGKLNYRSQCPDVSDIEICSQFILIKV